MTHVENMTIDDDLFDKDLPNVIYLDNNATTREDKCVVQAMINYLKSSNLYGNASSSHLVGIKTRQLVDRSREFIKNSINASDLSEIIITSGGTESNNLAIQGVIKSNLNEFQHIITSPFEHPSVENTLRNLRNSYPNQIEISFVNVNSDGIVDIEHFRQLLTENTKLVTIMHSNNEIGSIQPIEEIVKICREHRQFDVIVHSDASQSLGKMEIDVDRLGLDLLTICSHKFHGPKGIGALFRRKGIQLENVIYGGNHEQGLRPGTENILGTIGLGKACQLISNKYLLNQRIQQMKFTRDKLYQGLCQQFKLNGENFIIRNGNQQTLPNTLNLTIRGIDGRQLIQQLNQRLAFSTGSACHETDKSHSISTTLRAIGLSSELARGTIRLSTSYMTTEDEIDQAIVLLTNEIKRQIVSNHQQN